jgi:hypothetical protein
MAGTVQDTSGGPAPPASAFPERHRIVRRWVWVAAASLVVAVVALALIVFGTASANDSEKVGLEAAKAGFQLLVLAAAGFGVTGALEWFSRQQDERRRVNDAAVVLLRELIDSYNRLKGTRRVLRALGFDKPQLGSVMSAHQREAFEREMRTLLEVQLTLERIGREIGVRLDEDDTSPRTRPQELLADMDSYVKAIVKEWEENGAPLAFEGADLATSMAAFPCLRAFLKHSREDPEFRLRASDPLREIETFFRDRLVVKIPLEDKPSTDTGE